MKTEEFTLLKDQLRRLNKKISDIEAFKGHFLSNVRNTIINPFTSIVGLSEEIIKSDKEDWKKVILMASMIHGEAFDLDFQLNNIFCAAELESGEIHPDPSRTDLVELINKILKKYDIRFRRKNISIKPAFDVITTGQDRLFHTDPRFIETIVSNLLDNAVKFSEDGGEIKVSLIQNKDKLHISIEDSGKGMCETDRIKIFDRFKRLDPSINSIESGHGLGLSIVKVLTELLEGKVSVESDIGSGSRFHIEIPAINTDTELMHYSSDGAEFLFVEDESF